MNSIQVIAHPVSSCFGFGFWVIHRVMMNYRAKRDQVNLCACAQGTDGEQVLFQVEAVTHICKDRIETDKE